MCQDKNKMLVENISAMRFENTFNGKIVSEMKDEKLDVGQSKSNIKIKIKEVDEKRSEYFEGIMQSKYTYNKTKINFICKLKAQKFKSKEFEGKKMTKPKVANFFSLEDETPDDIVDIKTLLKHRIQKSTANNKEKLHLVNKYYITMSGIKECFECLQKYYIIDSMGEVSSIIAKSEDQNHSLFNI